MDSETQKQEKFDILAYDLEKLLFNHYEKEVSPIYYPGAKENKYANQLEHHFREDKKRKNKLRHYFKIKQLKTRLIKKYKNIRNFFKFRNRSLRTVFGRRNVTYYHIINTKILSRTLNIKAPFKQEFEELFMNHYSKTKLKRAERKRQRFYRRKRYGMLPPFRKKKFAIVTTYFNTSSHNFFVTLRFGIIVPTPENTLPTDPLKPLPLTKHVQPVLSKVMYKTSTGQCGSKTTKKKTFFARLDVVQLATEHLDKIPSMFLIITINGKVKMMRARRIKKLLTRKPNFYILSIVNTTYRSHGYERHKKAKRL